MVSSERILTIQFTKMRQTFFSTLILAFLLGILSSCNPTSSKLADDQPRRIEFLFLGHDSEHHNSQKYAPILASKVSEKGINITYTSDVEDLNSKYLDLFDGIIIYANHDSITQQQDKALMSFISDGHALIPIHCASYCFRNSPEYVDAVGGQFKSHGAGDFTAKITNKSHPITSSLVEFSTWDETYVHEKIADDIEILMERVEGDHNEPWTWTKEYGKGKVFYTAYGHDENTWENPGFLQLLENGILWAVSDQVKTNWKAYTTEMPLLTYEERPKIPNYEKRDPAPKFQLPLTPEESAKLMQVPMRFEVQLFASEPDIINPIAMNWDERGRLWVIETVDYPNTVRNEQGIGDDRLKICEDTDGDGKADKFTVFADKLNIPTSFTFANGGIIVSQAPEFLYLKDTDGDDVADVRETIIEGWGVYDTHAGPSNLQMGIDNKIYGVVGYSGFAGKIFGKEEEFRQGLYRFDTDYRDFEFLTSTSNNTWGLGIAADNSIFASTANNTHSVHMAIPNRLYKGVKGIKAQGSIKIDGHYGMFSINPNVRQVDVFDGFTAAAGHHFYTASDFPESYRNKVAFVCEPTGGLVHKAEINELGSGYVEKDGGNIIASSDEWFSPVEAKTGPDGAVWVLDWYNFIIQHNPTPNENFGGFKGENGEGNAYINPLRDKSKGRVWRIINKKAKHSSPEALDKNNEKALLKALSNDNMFWRMTAQRQIVENKMTNLLDGLYKTLKNKKKDAFGNNYASLHALWAIEGLVDINQNEQAKASLRDALSHPSPDVRRAAIQALPKMKWVDKAIIEADLIHDSDPKVKLAAILYFAEREPYLVDGPQRLGELIYELSKDEDVVKDKWLATATYIAAVRHRGGFMEAFKASNPNFVKKENEALAFQDPELDDGQWSKMQLPQFIEDAGLQIDGIVWFRKNINLASTNSNSEISLGPIDDSDLVYINGIKVGGIEQEYATDRKYSIPNGVLKTGVNVIAVRVEDTGSGGGIYGAPSKMFLKVGTAKQSLVGEWRYFVADNYSAAAENIFEKTSIAEMLIDNYMDKQVIEESSLSEVAEARIVKITTIKNEMKYDVESFEVTAGETIELQLENVDFMQHNLIILEPGSLERVGAAADKLASDPRGAEKYYIPEMTEILVTTKLVNPQETVIVRFTAPEKEGTYPYVCTFPGHWRIMQGEMIVRSKVAI